MKDRQYYEQKKAEGLNFAPKGWVYIGKGLEDNSHMEAFPCIEIKTSLYNQSPSSERLAADYSGNSGNCPHWHYFVSEEAWNAKFPHVKPVVTLDFLKSQMAKAESLIGKKIKNRYSEGIIKEVKLSLVKPRSSLQVEGFFEENGYCIIVSYPPHAIPFTDDILDLVEDNVEVSTINGEKYSAEDCGDCWKFGCANIDKGLIRGALELFKHGNGEGDRSVEEIRIGKGIFTEEILQKLVDAE